MYLIPILFCISLIFNQVSTDFESTSHFGLMFVFTVPRFDDVAVSMVLTTGQKKPFEVYLFLYKTSLKEPFEVAIFSVSATEPANYLMDPGLLSSTESGKHGCLIINSPAKFAVFVHMSEVSGSAASLTLLPVNIWGRRYTVVTLTTRPFIVVFSAEPTEVKLRFKMDPPSSVRIVVDDDIFTDRSTYMFHLDSNEAFTLSRCGDQYKNEILSLSGSLVESTRPVGVISGSCRSYMKVSTRYVQHYMPDDVEICRHYGATINRDLAADMLIPQYMYGTTYDAVALSERLTHEMYVISPTVPGTNVHLSFREHSNEHYKLRGAEDLRVAPLNFTLLERGARRITATDKIFLALVVTSTCGNVTELGGPSIVSILHIDMFHKFYAWRQPSYVNMRHFVVIIAKRNDVICINGQEVKFKVEDIISFYIDRYVQRSLELQETVVTVSSDSVFSCYFYGMRRSGGGGGGAYITLGGLAFLKLRTLECIHTPAVGNDNVDNDCDGKTDEEILDEIDNDKDGLCDEDFKTDTNVKNVSYKWGPRCLLNCSGCANGCSSVDGRCNKCRDGYQSIWSGCDQKMCPPLRYGLQCEGDCMTKCGTDCENHRSGRCPAVSEETSLLIWYLTIGFVATIILLWMMLSLITCATKHLPKPEIRLRREVVKYPEITFNVDSRSQAYTGGEPSNSSGKSGKSTARTTSVSYSSSSSSSSDGSGSSDDDDVDEPERQQQQQQHQRVRQQLLQKQRQQQQLQLLRRKESRV